MMFKYLKQNKNIIVVACGLFLVSMSTLLFFLNQSPQPKDNFAHDIKTSVIEHTSSPEAIQSHEEDEKVYRAITKNTDDAIVVIKTNGMIDFVSPNFENMAGYTEEDIKNTIFFKLISQEGLGTFLDAFSKVVDKEEPLPIVGPYQLKNSTGNYQYFIGSMYPIMWKGKIAKIALTLKDINESVNQNANSTGADAQPEQKKHYPGKVIRDEENDKTTLENKIAQRT